jgi:DNA-binding IclR family transcriptional regulator
MLGEDTGRTLKTTRTSLRVLELVLERGGLTLAELDRLVDAPKSSLHAHLTTLRDCRYLVQDGDTYEVAFRLALLGDRVRHRHPVDGIAADVVEELAGRTDEEANFTVLEHGRLRLVHGASGRSAETTDSEFRTEYYLHNTAAGKAILAGLDRERVKRVVDEWGLPKETEATITDRDRLFEELAATRSRGYGLVDEEFAPGLVAAGAPVRDADGIVGGLSVGGPKYRIDTARLEADIVDALFDAVEALEDALVDE